EGAPIPPLFDARGCGRLISPSTFAKWLRRDKPGAPNEEVWMVFGMTESRALSQSTRTGVYGFPPFPQSTRKDGAPGKAPSVVMLLDLIDVRPEDRTLPISAEG